MILQRYISEQILWATFALTAALTGAIWFAQSLRFMDFLVGRGVPLLTFLQLVFFLLPDLIVLSLPMGFLLGTVLVYNKLINDCEITVMRTAGCSAGFLLKPALKTAGILTFFLYIITLFILPLSFQEFRKIEKQMRHYYSADMVRAGEFNVLGAVTVYVNARTQEGFFEGLLIHDARQVGHYITVTAEKGVLLDDAKGLRFVLKNGTRQEWSGTQSKPSLLMFEQYVLRLNPQSVSAEKKLKPYEMSVFQLFGKAPPEGGGDMRQKMRAEGHSRLLLPLFTAVFGSVAVFFLLSYQGGGRQARYLKNFLILFGCAALQGVVMAFLQSSAVFNMGIFCAYLFTFSPLLWVVWFFYRKPLS